MSSIESYIGQRPMGPPIKPYSMLDTNEDEVIAPEELVLPSDRSGTTGEPEIPTVSAADTLTDPVAAALLDVHLAEDPAASIADAVAAYHADDVDSPSA